MNLSRREPSASSEPVRAPEESRLRSRLRAGYPFALLGVLPLALLAIDVNWIFSDLYNDPWDYFGYFLNLPNHLRTFGDWYFADRLSVLLPGYLLHRVLPDLWAHVLLHLIGYELAIQSIYLALRARVGNRAALFASMAMGCHFYVLKALGWDYVDGFGIAYLSLTIALLVRAGRSKRRGMLLMMAGFTSAATLVANPGYLVFLLPAGFLIVPGWRQASLKQTLRDIFCLGCGVLVFLLIVEASFFAMTGEPWTMKATRDFQARLLSQGNYFKYPPSLWLPNACWLVFPAAMSAGGLAFLLGHAPWRKTPCPEPGAAALAFPAMLVSSAVMCVAIDVFTPSAILELFFYASLLLPAAFLALGTISARLWDSLSPLQYGCVMVLAVPLFVVAGVAPGMVPKLAPAAIPPAVAALVPGLLAVALAIRGRGPAAAAAFCLLLGVSQLVASQQFRIELCLPPAMSAEFEGMSRFDHNRASVTRLIAQTTRTILADEPEGNTYFWYRMGEPLGIVFKAISNTHLSARRKLGRNLPEIPAGGKTERGLPLVSGMKVAILSSYPDQATVIDAARRSLQRLGLDLEIRSVHRFRSSGIAYSLFLTRLKRSE